MFLQSRRSGFSMPSISLPCSSMDVRTSTPRLSARLVACLLAHSIRLTLVLRHSGVDLPTLCQSLPSLIPCYFAYWTISGRIGALKTLGRGCVSLPAAPSAPWMVTVGRLVIVAVVVLLVVDDIQRLFEGVVECAEIQAAWHSKSWHDHYHMKFTLLNQKRTA